MTIGYYWLSFTDRIGIEVLIDLGSAIVPGYDLNDAVIFAYLCGIHPGGQVAGVRLVNTHHIPLELLCRRWSDAERAEALKRLLGAAS